MGGSGREPQDNEGPGVVDDLEPSATSRPFPKFTMAAAAVVAVVSIPTTIAFADSAVVPPLAATAFWMALLLLAIIPTIWAVRRSRDRTKFRRQLADRSRLELARRPGMTPEPPEEGWSTPHQRGGLWYSYDERGRQRVFGTFGWTTPRWPSLPLTPFERRLRAAILALIVISAAFGVVPAFATVGPCMFVPCDRQVRDTAAFTVDGAGDRTLVVPRCLGDVQGVSIETYPAVGERVPLWAISSATPSPLPDAVPLDQTPEGFRQDTALTAPLPVGEPLWVEIRTQGRRFVTSTFAVNGSVGEVSSGEPDQTTSLASFTQRACEEVTYHRPQPPIIAVLAILLGYLGVPALTAWLVVHHSIEKRRQGPTQRSGPHAMSA